MHLTLNKKLSVFALVMINVIAVDSLRTLPLSAKFGVSLVFYYLLIAVLFFIPVAYVTSKLAVTWPKTGGIYVWVREAFGDKLGFLVIWLQWIYNVTWYPTILSFVAGIVAYFIEPKLIDNNYYMAIFVIISFSLATFFNMFGMYISGLVSTIGAIFGTLLPMLFIIALGAFWILNYDKLDLIFTASNLIPKVDSIRDVALVTTIMFGLMGLEMSAVHAGDVNNPKKDYPKALKISAAIILFTLMLSSLAIAVVIPEKELNIVTGLLQAFAYFLQEFKLDWLLPVLGILIVLGSTASVAAWIIGPTKGLLVAAQEHTLPKVLRKTNKHGVPVVILILQLIIVIILSLAYTFFQTVESAYLLLTELTAILSLLMYILFFVSAFVLKNKIMGNKKYITLAAIIGGITSLIAMILSFVPPAQIELINYSNYPVFLILGTIIFCLPAVFIHKIK